MGKEANLRHKSTKTPVQIYRAFLKLSLAGAIYAAFCAFKGSSIAFAVTVSLLGGIGYEISYLVYKSSRKQSQTKQENTTWKQVLILVRFAGFMLGLTVLLLAADMLRRGEPAFGISLMLVGLVLCQQMHNNTHLTSHLSTFCENAAVGTAVIALELLYSTLYLKEGGYAYIIAISVTAVLYALSEFFFHFFNCKKHTTSEVKKKSKKLLRELLDGVDLEKMTEKEFEAKMAEQDKRIYREFLLDRTLILDRLAEFLRNILLVAAIWAVFALLIISGSVEFAIKIGIYDKAIAIIPIIISIATPAIDSKKGKDGKSMLDKYDPRIPPEELKRDLINSFGEDCHSVKALDYVCKNMNAKHRLVRYNGEDYCVHPIAVAKIIIDNTIETDEIIAAALLHDCIEDVWNCTYATLVRDYPETNIPELVKLVSKEPDKDYKNPVIMQEYLDKIAENTQAAIIKIADRINNLNTLDNCTDEAKRLKKEETKKFYIPFVENARTKDKNAEKNKHFYDLAAKCFKCEDEKEDKK